MATPPVAGFDENKRADDRVDQAPKPEQHAALDKAKQEEPRELLCTICGLKACWR